MLAPRLTVEPVKLSERLFTRWKFDFNAGSFCFANGPAHSALQVREELRKAATKVQRMSIKATKGRKLTDQIKPTASLVVIPAAIAAKRQCMMEQLEILFTYQEQRRTEIGQRDRHSTPSGEAASDLNDRQQSGHARTIRDRKVSRTMPVSVGQDTRPRGAVKETRVTRRRDFRIPTYNIVWIKDLDLGASRERRRPIYGHDCLKFAHSPGTIPHLRRIDGLRPCHFADGERFAAAN